MEELIQRVVERTGIDATSAEKAVGAILAFLKKEGPPEHVETLVQSIPGGEEAADAPKPGSGGLMGMVSGVMGGGGVMGLGAQLMGMGISMDQIGNISKELFAYGREKAGEDTMGAIVGHIPGLSQFV